MMKKEDRMEMDYKTEMDQKTEHAGHGSGQARSSGRRTSRGRGVSRPRGGSQSGRPARRSIASELILLLMKIGMIVVFFIVMFTLFFGIMQQPDRSMEPAVKEGDLIIYYRLQKEFESRDTVILENPEGEKQCRRIAAGGGDTLNITEDGLEINGYHQQEEGIYTETLPYTGAVVYPVSLEAGNYFVLADNRDNTEDSRVYGQVDDSAIRGGVLAIIRRRGI